MSPDDLTGEEEVLYDRRGGVSNTTIWAEIRYIRRKVDSLESKVLYMFGTMTAISLSIAIYELLRNKP